jgi:integrase/recombinase XerD
MGQPAKVLSSADVRLLLVRVRQSPTALRDLVMVLLSFRAGLRACEIAGLDWMMVVGPNGRIASSLVVAGSIAKNGRGRQLPLHLELRRALEDLHRAEGRPATGPVVRSQRRTGRMRPKSVVNWFRQLYATLGLPGCSSHSGRRTFITTAAKLIGRAGGSLRDVQELAGHRSLTSTERYIEGDRDAHRKLVRLL